LLTLVFFIGPVAGAAAADANPLFAAAVALDPTAMARLLESSADANARDPASGNTLVRAADLIRMADEAARAAATGQKLYFLTSLGPSGDALDMVLNVDEQGNESLIDCCLQNPYVRYPTDIPALVKKWLEDGLR